MSDTEKQIEAARRLLRGRFHAILSTSSAKFEGHPFGSLVPYCLDRREQPLLLLSHLSEHTRNLDADPRCAFTLSEEKEGDVQQSTRLTGMATAVMLHPDESPAASERYFRYFPAARPYFEQLGFRFYRLQPLRFYFVGGFGTARWFGTDRILKASAFADDEAESTLIQQLDAEGDWLQSIGSVFDNTGKEPSAVAGIDAEGVDLRLGDRLRRVEAAFPRLSVEGVMAGVNGR